MKEFLQELEKIIDYMWHDEEKDWEENGRPDNHIFVSLQTVKKILEYNSPQDYPTPYGHSIEEWTNAIATRFGDECIGVSDESEIVKSLGIFLAQSPEAVKDMIGTPIIEEDYFDA